MSAIGPTSAILETDFAYWIELTGLLRNVSLSMTAPIAAIVGLIGLRTWKRKILWERKLYVADELFDALQLVQLLLLEISEVDKKRNFLEAIDDRREREDFKLELTGKLASINGQFQSALLSLGRLRLQTDFLFERRISQLIIDATKEAKLAVVDIREASKEVRREHMIQTSFQLLLARST